MASLAGVSADVEASLMEIQKLLTEEKEKEKQYQVRNMLFHIF
jgi:hypothetical protein